MNRKLNTSDFSDAGTVWSHYDGDEAYGDFTVSGTTVTDTDSYQPGLWRRMKVGTNFVAEYLHNDHLGTLRAATNTSGASSGGDVFTAFEIRGRKSGDTIRISRPSSSFARVSLGGRDDRGSSPIGGRGRTPVPARTGP